MNLNFGPVPQRDEEPRPERDLSTQRKLTLTQQITSALLIDEIHLPDFQAMSSALGARVALTLASGANPQHQMASLEYLVKHYPALTTDLATRIFESGTPLDQATVLSLIIASHPNLAKSLSSTVVNADYVDLKAAVRRCQEVTPLEPDPLPTRAERQLVTDASNAGSLLWGKDAGLSIAERITALDELLKSNQPIFVRGCLESLRKVAEFPIFFIAEYLLDVASDSTPASQPSRYKSQAERLLQDTPFLLSDFVKRISEIDNSEIHLPVIRLDLRSLATGPVAQLRGSLLSRDASDSQIVIAATRSLLSTSTANELLLDLRGLRPNFGLVLAGTIVGRHQDIFTRQIAQRLSEYSPGFIANLNNVLESSPRYLQTLGVFDAAARGLGKAPTSQALHNFLKRPPTEFGGDFERLVQRLAQHDWATIDDLRTELLRMPDSELPKFANLTGLLSGDRSWLRLPGANQAAIAGKFLRATDWGPDIGDEQRRISVSELLQHDGEERLLIKTALSVNSINGDKTASQELRQLDPELSEAIAQLY